MAVTASTSENKVFDATIHVRTLELLEGQQLNGHGTIFPTLKMFHPGFKGMILCMCARATYCFPVFNFIVKY